ncbi:HNH endonuclease signature motif containing protein [Rhizobium sp. CC-YZS058]|uniref:HNH endonuclease signature motif containing protein n=1 Tax=Rhizobium sp. CC-YZS058 TaxID=3042153 RepID=UPI002B05DB32|nr:HNH endonuclease signature motif containing protein [Rhizobium sp. CC-YZS058]MEA3534256.1 HNH endonuclease signature motif containing protein [Rhizobium sp. CC-YZS058]
MTVSRRDQIRARILERVVIDPETDCWIWTGPTSGDVGRGANYPRMSLSGQTVAVHKAMWTNEHGLIPSTRQLDHVCRNRLCVNPDNLNHVQLVTRKRNMLRMWDARRAAMQCEETTRHDEA